MRIDQPTISDGGPWLTVWDDDEGLPHVIPGFGPKHVISKACWCHPTLDPDYVEVAVSHNVAQ